MSHTLGTGPRDCQAVIDALGEHFLVLRFSPHGHLTDVSDASVPMLGLAPESAIRGEAHFIVQGEPNTAARDALGSVLEGEATSPFPLLVRARDGQVRQLRVFAAPTRDPAGAVVGVTAVAQDVTTQARWGTMEQARRRALECLLAGDPVDTILDQLARSIESLNPDMMCSVLLLDGRRLRHYAAPSLPPDYVAATDGVQIGFGVGSCGTAAVTGQRVICEDLLTHPYFAAFTPLIEPTPLRACWSEPILGREAQVLGTFAMYYRQQRTPTAGELAIIEAAAQVCALVLERRADHDALNAAEARARLLLETTAEGLIGVDSDGCVTFTNRAATELLGAPPEALRGVAMHHLLGEPAPANTSDCPTLDTARTGQPHSITDATLVRTDGDTLPIDYRTTPIHEGDRLVGAVVSVHDAQARRKAEAEIRHLAYHDELTGLANRTRLDHAITDAVRRLQRGEQGAGFAVHLLDLDHFKQINDTLGHPAGDAVLVAVAERLRGAARTTDTVARLGGDEFAVLQRAVQSGRNAARLAERLQGALEPPMSLEHATVRTQATVGIALGLDPIDADAEAAITHADVALYQAKAQGRGSFAFYDHEMTARLQREVTLANALPNALAEDALQLVYQPIVDLVTERVVAYEAYLRWPHAELGLLTPGDFLAAAEARGLGPAIDQWVLARACQQLRAWDAAGHEVPRVHVNVTDSGVTDAEWLAGVPEVAARHGLPLHRLGLDVTEEALTLATPEALDALTALTAEGLYLTLDDFATGLTRIGPVVRLGARAIEMDRQFVATLPDPHSTAVARAMVAMAEALTLKVVAEGVEDAETLATLRDLGCTHARGYLLGRPQPAEGIAG